MLYILTEEEYLRLKQDVEDIKTSSKETINSLCQMIADKVPLKLGDIR